MINDDKKYHREFQAICDDLGIKNSCLVYDEFVLVAEKISSEAIQDVLIDHYSPITTYWTDDWIVAIKNEITKRFLLEN